MICHPCCWYPRMISSHRAANSSACWDFLGRLRAGRRSWGGDLVDETATRGCYRTVPSLMVSRPGGGDPSVLDANYPPPLTVGRRPLGGGGGGGGGGAWRGGSRRGAGEGGSRGGGGAVPGVPVGGGGVGHLRTVGYAAQV